MNNIYMHSVVKLVETSIGSVLAFVNLQGLQFSVLLLQI